MKVLVVRFSAMGDCIMACWPATALRLHVPDAELGWAVQTPFAPVLDERLVGKVFSMDRELWRRDRRPLASTYHHLRAYLALRKHEFDVGFDLQGHTKTALCLRLSGAKRRLAARATDSFSRKLNPVAKLRPPSPHEVDLYDALFRTVWPDLPRVERPWMPLLDEERREASRLRGARPLVTLQVGGSEAKKLWPAERWGVVAAGMLERGWSVILIGGPKDPKVLCEGAHDWVGKKSLRESLGAVAASDLHIAGDTGTGHAAAAYGVPVVSLFGHNKPERFRPWTPNGIALREGTDPKLITVAQVLQAVDKLTEGRQFALFD